MAQPVWGTAAGDLGTYPSGVKLSIQLIATGAESVATYKLLSGSLPESANSLTLSSTGQLTGVPSAVATDTITSFTVRITDGYGLIRDRTFSLTISGSPAPKFLTPDGVLFGTVDSKWVHYPMQYVNPIATNTVKIELTLGELPPGLMINEQGLIQGYPLPPVTVRNKLPATISYSFTLTLYSPLGNTTGNYSITVGNQRLTSAPESRQPVILNNNPLTLTVSPKDPYYDYYLSEDNNIPTITSGDYFSFKVIGHDFDGSALSYAFSDLPLGLVGHVNTGWITGTPTLGTTGISRYYFNVRTMKSTNFAISSPYTQFVLTVAKDIKDDITWFTPSDLGTISNGAISDFHVIANSKYALSYRIVGGDLPYNLSFIDTGEIIGRVAQQPTDTYLNAGDKTIYNFSIEAYAPDYPVLISKKDFTFTVSQDYPYPYENIYFKATPNLTDRVLLDLLLKNTTIIPDEYLYRKNDPFFGKAKNISYVHAYGMKSSTIEKYIDAVSQSHYRRTLVLGGLKTAVAKDIYGNVIYEVVYSTIIDDLINTNGVSTPAEIIWPRDISLDQGPWQASNGDIHTSYDVDITGKQYYASLTPGYIRKLRPASTTNMRNQLAQSIGLNFDSKLLPRWMQTQQANGVILGYIQAWVICYTLPGYSTTVKDNINNIWDGKINNINFEVDRYLVDKSATYDWNTYLQLPQWTGLPSATPVPNPTDANDFAVLFPKKTILPK